MKNPLQNHRPASRGLPQLRIGIAGALLAIVAASSAHAGPIAINFKGDQNTGSAYGANVTASAFGIPAGSWVSGQHTGTNEGGSDSVAPANLPTGVAASWTFANDWALGTTAGGLPGEEEVVFGFLGDGNDSGPGAKITVTGLSGWLAANQSSSYKLEVIFATNNNTYGFKNTPLLDGPGGNNLGTLVAQNLTQTTVYPGVYGVGTVQSLTSNTIYIDGQDRDRTAVGDPQNLRGSIAGIIITPDGTAPAGSPTISVNFRLLGDVDGNSVDADESATQFANTGGQFWNNITIKTGSRGALSTALGNTPLMDSAGNPAATLVPANLGVGAGFAEVAGTSAPAEASTGEAGMMQSLLNFGGAPAPGETLTVSGLPASITSSGYRVLLYFDLTHQARTYGFTVGDGSTSTTFWTADSTADADADNDGVIEWKQATGTTSGTATPDASYAEFTGLSGSSFTISGVSVSGRPALSGFQVIPNNYAPALAINSFTASRKLVSPGSQATLDWSTTNATSLTLNPGNIDLLPFSQNGNGSRTVTVNESTVFTLTAGDGNGGSTMKSVTVNTGTPRPNIVLFLVDDMGWQDTSVPFHHDAAGNPIVTTQNTLFRTPNMAALAANGMKFSNACAFPVCSPTRTSIMTGLNTARHRVTTWTDANTPQNTATIPAGSPMLNPPNWEKGGMSAANRALAFPQLLKAAGYHTIHAGKGHFGPASTSNGNPINVGFEVNIGGSGAGSPGTNGYYGTSNFGVVPGPQLNAYHGQDIHLSEALTLEINKEIENAVNAGEPFFAYMSHYAVHTPFIPDARFTANYPSLSGTDLAFATLIEGMDKSLGDIIAKLNALGVAEDTLVIFLSDNGSDRPGSSPSAPLTGKKGFANEAGNRVPFIAAWAKRNAGNPFQASLAIPAASLETDIITCMDIYPTILDVAGVPFSNPVDGVSLRPYLRGETGTHRPQEFLVHFPHPHQYEDFYGSLRQENWKLIWRYVDGNDHWELYNLDTDIGESNNLINLPAHQPKLMSLARRFARQLVEMNAVYAVNSNTSQPKKPIMPDIPGLDTDGDGISDTAEDPNRNGIRDAGETDPDLSDTDADGTTDGNEVRTGTNPLDGHSFFRVTPEVIGGSLVLRWPSAPVAVYRIESSDTMEAGDWDVVIDNLPASAGSETTYNLGVPGGLPRLFYRLVLR